MSPRKATVPPSSSPTPTNNAPVASPEPEAVAALDPDRAKAAFEALLPSLRTLRPEELKNTRPDLQLAAAYVLGVAQRLAPKRALFAALPPELFDIAAFDRLNTAALAA